VVVRDDPAWSDLDREALALTLSAMVGGANVEFATVESSARVSISVIERGAGWTRACGTGSVATAAVLGQLGEVDGTVVIANPGGDLAVTITGNDATLAGPVRFVADVVWTVP
jgi:diaminopimelate epimerase